MLAVKSLSCATWPLCHGRWALRTWPCPGEEGRGAGGTGGARLCWPAHRAVGRGQSGPVGGAEADAGTVPAVPPAQVCPPLSEPVSSSAEWGQGCHQPWAAVGHSETEQIDRPGWRTEGGVCVATQLLGTPLQDGRGLLSRPGRLAFSRRPGLGATGPGLQQKSLSWQMRGARPRLSHLRQGPGALVWAEAELFCHRDDPAPAPPPPLPS